MRLPAGAPNQQQQAAGQHWQQPAAPKRPRPLPRLAAAATSTAERPAAVTSAPATPAPGPVVLKRGKVMHSLSQERLELFRSLDGFAEEQVLPLLKPPTKCWQPSDFLPSPELPDFMDEVRELRARAAELPPDYFVVLVGDMITEEALPTYMAMLNTLDGVRDESGSDPGPWARWTRQWVAEENRHGDLLNKYCYLTGRVDMRAVEVTIQQLIGSGMDPQTENNPYHCFIYTSFQERATKVSHGNTGRQALQHGDAALAKLCGIIAADESRHEVAYSRIVDELFRLDPSGAMLAFADMMRKQIVMPAHWMDDAQHGSSNAGRNLFTDYSLVAERLGVYDAHDYLEIMTHLITRWDVNSRTGLAPEAEQAQDYLMQLPGRLERLAERAASRKRKSSPDKKAALARFSWVFNQEVAL